MASDRTRSLGASDAAPAVGLSRFKTPLELYLEKIGESPGPAENLPMKMGKALEPLILLEFEDETGLAVGSRQKVVVDPAADWRTATLDGIASDGALVEAKSTSMDDAWGEEDEEIPLDVACQVQHQMAVTSAALCYVPVLFLFSRRFQVYRVPRDQEMIDLLTEREAAFWQRVMKREPPEPVSESDMRLRWPQDNGTTVVASRDVRHALLGYHSARDVAKQHEDLAAEARKTIIAYMGEASNLADESGKIICTFRRSKDSEAFDVKRFQAEQPDLYQQYLAPKPGSRRFLPKRVI